MKDDLVALAEHPCEVSLPAGRSAADRAIVVPPLVWRSRPRNTRTSQRRRPRLTICPRRRGAKPPSLHTRLLGLRMQGGPPVQSLEPLAHIGDSRGQIDPRRWTQSKHGLRPLEDSQQAFESIRIKIRMYLDPAPARQRHGQPTTRFLLRQQFPGVQLHRHQSTGPRTPTRSNHETTTSSGSEERTGNFRKKNCCFSSPCVIRSPTTSITSFGYFVASSLIISCPSAQAIARTSCASNLGWQRTTMDSAVD